MKKKNTKKVIRCATDGCRNERRTKDRFCNFHGNKVTTTRFLAHLYSNMKKRVQGKHGSPQLYKDKPLIAKEVFLNWAKNHPDFLRLYKQWVMCDYDIKLAPSVNRINSRKGYTLDNMEWVTFSQNCMMAAAVKKIHQRKAIYNLLGVNDG